MRINDQLIQVRPIWLNRVSHKLARGEGLRESFLEELHHFYDMLEQAVEMGDLSGLDEIICGWVQALTQSESERKELTVLPILHTFLITMQEVASEVLDSGSALQLLAAVQPLFLHGSETAARQEMKVHIERVSADLEKANLALERLDRSKSDFIAVAAHELKTPLTLIEGYTSMIRELLPAGDQKLDLGILLKGIDIGNERLRVIIEDMIDVSLIDNNLLTLSFQPVWIDRILSGIEDDVRTILADRQQTLQVKDFPGCREMFFGDGERLLQALRNIVLNAIKYTPDGGKITIDGRLLPGFIEITFTDTGIGIHPEDLTWIFEKFGRSGSVQTHSSGKIKFKGGGPGLGLAISKGIIEAHGGAIWVESEGYDEIRCPGSVFHVLLPTRKQPPNLATEKLFLTPSE